jgi:hypothetical protein
MGTDRIDGIDRKPANQLIDVICAKSDHISRV